MKPGALHGVPIAIMEAFDVAGMHTTSSSPPLKDNVARCDAAGLRKVEATWPVTPP